LVGWKEGDEKEPRRVNVRKVELPRKMTKSQEVENRKKGRGGRETSDVQVTTGGVYKHRGGKQTEGKSGHVG